MSDKRSAQSIQCLHRHSQNFCNKKTLLQSYGFFFDICRVFPVGLWCVRTQKMYAIRKSYADCMIGVLGPTFHRSTLLAAKQSLLMCPVFFVCASAFHFSLFLADVIAPVLLPFACCVTGHHNAKSFPNWNVLRQTTTFVAGSQRNHGVGHRKKLARVLVATGFLAPRLPA